MEGLNKMDIEKCAKDFVSSKLMEDFDNLSYFVEDGLVYFENMRVAYMFHAYLLGVKNTIDKQ